MNIKLTKLFTKCFEDSSIGSKETKLIIIWYIELVIVSVGGLGDELCIEDGLGNPHPLFDVDSFDGVFLLGSVVTCSFIGV